MYVHIEIADFDGISVREIGFVELGRKTRILACRTSFAMNERQRITGLKRTARSARRIIEQNPFARQPRKRFSARRHNGFAFHTHSARRKRISIDFDNIVPLRRIVHIHADMRYYPVSSVLLVYSGRVYLQFERMKINRIVEVTQERAQRIAFCIIYVRTVDYIRFFKRIVHGRIPPTSSP